MKDIKDKGFDEIILDQDLDLLDPMVFYTFANYYERGEGVEEHHGLSDFFNRVAEALEGKELEHPLAIPEENDLLINQGVAPISEEDEISMPDVVENPFDDKAGLDISFYQESHENTKNKLIEEAKAKYQSEIRDALGDTGSAEIELIFENNDEVIDYSELSAKETYKKAIELIDEDKFEEGLDLLKSIGDKEDIDEETLARASFVLALAYPDEDYAKYATMLAWKNKEESYAKDFLDYFYNHDCGEAYRSDLTTAQKEFLNIEEEVNDTPLEVEEMNDNDEVSELLFDEDPLAIDKDEDTGSTSILHETANLEKLILDTESEEELEEGFEILKNMFE